MKGHGKKSLQFANLLSYFLSETWIKCDDDKISHVTADEVLKLSGGGKLHPNFGLYLLPLLYLAVSFSHFHSARNC